MENKVYDKYFVIKNEDIEKYLALEDAKDLKALIQRLAVSKRCNSGEKDNTYLVVNTDEPYAALVKDLILNNVNTDNIPEEIKEKLSEEYAEDIFEEFQQIQRFEGKITLKDVADILQIGED
jgi:hypothetical protein